jgi:undecaprenyl pyrophosphate phosphatase UppP
MQDDNDLADFLRQHQPIEPSKAIDLEERIMQSIESIPMATVKHHRRKWLYLGVGITTIIGAIGGLFFYKSIESPQLNIAEIHSAETFLEAHWQEIVPNIDRSGQNGDEVADIDLLPEIDLETEDM